jgi:hypothetical protein
MGEWGYMMVLGLVTQVIGNYAAFSEGTLFLK